jgi:pimeloyl-ACP methyl ester carboxylesterase/DNA-binding SARP family transcriptional activator/class 3 adenylate cyclase
MTALLHIKVLGGFAVLRDGEPVTMPPSKKTRALLAYLAVERKPHRRERLCELFWGMPDDPRGSLRWSLSKLRQILSTDHEPLLRADRNVVELAEGIELDYDALADLSADSVDQLPTERLEAAANAFTGPFLEDLYLSRCPEFEAWRTFHATRTEMLQLKVLRCLIEQLRDAPERALTHLLTLQSLLPDEDLGTQIQAARSRAQQAIKESGAPAPDAEARNEAPTAAAGGESSAPVRYCRASDGTRIAYAVDGTGPAIVRTAHWMSHIGLERRSPVWAHWLTTITRDFSLVRYDERLNGLSDQEADDVSFEAFIADLESVVDAAVPGQRVILLGISQGCPLAIEYAVRHPERVAGLILHGGFVRGWRARGDPGEIARREAMQVLIREGWGQNHPTFRQLFTSLFIPGANSEQAEWFNEVQRLTVTPDNAARLSEVFSRIDVSDNLGKLAVPTLVMHARRDKIAPLAEGRELAERIAGARLMELESENHILLQGEPAFLRFFDEVAKFAREVLPSPPVPIGDRRRYLATVLCAQIVSPIQALGNVDPDAPLELIDQLLVGAADLIDHNGGSVVEVSDNRIVAGFGDLPGNHAAAACRVAMALRELITRESRAIARIRISVDTGTVIATPPRIAAAKAENELRGPPVTTVKSVNQAMRREMVVITERTRDAAGDVLQTRRLQPREVVGFAMGQRLLELTEVASDDDASGDAVT